MEKAYSKKALVVLADGFEEIEAMSVLDILERAGVNCIKCKLEGKGKPAPEGYVAWGSHGIGVRADRALPVADGVQALVAECDAVILPGGQPGSDTLRDDAGVIELLRAFDAAGKLVCAVCAAPIALERAGLLAGRRATSYPGALKDPGACDYREDPVCVSGNVVTSRGPATAPFFAFAILKELGLGDRAAAVREAMLYPLVSSL
jgi:4-methyl-5(b-hydroxyethyl)-thiazole monophosphate biosynthesis